MKTSAACTTVAVAAVCLLGAGCSKSSSPAASTAATGGNTSAKPASNSGGSGGSGGGGGSASCKQLTFAQVQPLLIQKIMSVTTTAIAANNTGQQCVFNGKGSDSTGSITVSVLSGSLATQTYNSDLSNETKQNPVSGVGDKASRDSESGEIIALKGDLYCSVDYSSNDDVPGVGPLEEAHGSTNNIGENYWDAVAKALGTLCNRIYGSGNTTPDLSSLLNADTSASPSDGGSLPSATLPTDAPSS